MKKIFGLLLCAAAVLTVSCERQEQPFGFGNKGKAVKFTTSVGTKTALQGYTENGVEAVLWEDGDVFTVWSEQASVADSDQKWADYKVTASAGVATAVNPATEGVELLWGEGAHTFFAGYPAGKLQGNKLSANIPSSQKLNKLDDFVFGPALSEIGYMAASAQAQPDAATVNLAFKPLFSVFEFIVSAGETAEVNVTDFRLGVQEGSKVVLVGGFAANLSAQAAPEIVVDYSGASGEIKAQLGDGSGVKLLQGQTLTVSVIALPLDLSALIAYFTVDGKEVAVPLVKKDGSPILFPAGQKARVTALGVLAPETPPTPPTPADPVVITVEINGIPVTDYDISKSVADDGLLPGIFTIGGKKVRFSKGNLQAVLVNGAITEWQFAQNQWETAGDAWSLTNDTGTVGRFLNSTTAPRNRWGTHTLDFHTIEAGIDGAYMTITPEAEQLSKDYYIGSALQLYDNPDFAATYGSGWDYLTLEMIRGEYERTEHGSHGAYTDFYIARAAPARVEGVNGVVLFPDDYVQPAGIPLLKTDYVRYDSGGSGLAVALVDEVNLYDSAQWAQMESAGAVFIPAGYYYKGSEDVTLNAIINHHSGSTQHIVIESNGKYFGTTLYAHPTSPALVRLVKVVE